jgi:3,4-dihydroxy 2-butanone 4-phosphate synthase/GTP cyclohydrolase II
MICYADEENDPTPHIALISENTDISKPTLVRIHSECMTGDVFGSLRCDCGEQLDEALSIIGKRGGIVVYLRQEGRGIGLINKMKAYNLQDHGYDTAEANIKLGFEVDSRKFNIAVEILKDLGVTSLQLLTNNPIKMSSFKGSGIKMVGRVPLEVKPHKENEKYLRTKKEVMGHLIGNNGHSFLSPQ